MRMLNVILLALAGTATTAMAADIAMTPQQIKALGIQAAPLSGATAASGNLLPAQVAIPNKQIQVMSAPLAGMVERIEVASSQSVNAGQTLITLQSPDLAMLQRDYLQAQLQAQLANESLKRDSALYKDGIIPQSRYQTTRNNAAIQNAAASEKRQALKLAGMSDAAMRKLQSSGAISGRLDVSAPFAGVILEQMATPGQRVDLSTPLLKLAKLDPLWLEIQLPVDMAASVAPGSAVSVPAVQASGTVLSVGRNVLENNQTVLVRAEITSGAERLRPGQYVEARFATALAKNGAAGHWTVPNSAIVRQDKQVYVFVKTASGFRPQPVSIVSQTATSAVIKAPFKGNEAIVTQGAVAVKSTWQGVGAEGE